MQSASFRWFGGIDWEFQRVTHVTSNEWYGGTVWVEADFPGNRQLRAFHLIATGYRGLYSRHHSYSKSVWYIPPSFWWFYKACIRNISTNQDKISDIRLVQQGSKIITTEHILSRWWVGWQLHLRRWGMANVVHDVKMERRLVKHKCEEFHEKRILSDEEAFSATIKRHSLELLSHRSSSNSHDDACRDKEKKMNIMQSI